MSNPGVDVTNLGLVKNALPVQIEEKVAPVQEVKNQVQLG